MHWPNVADRYFVEDVCCSHYQRFSWSEHTFVMLWEPDKFVAWVDPSFSWSADGKLTGITPKQRWSHDGIPSWRMYHRSSTPEWLKVQDHFGNCHAIAEPHAPFDSEFKLVLNIAVGGYGGSPCVWGSHTCSTTCGVNVGSGMVVSDISVWKEFQEV